jgi:hypothetical protein
MTARQTQFRLGLDLSILMEAEAQALGVTIGRLVTADLNRYRRLAAEAIPTLTERQWKLLSHVLDGMDASSIVARDDVLPTVGDVTAGIMDWMRAGGSEERPAWARELYGAAQEWSPLTIAGVMLRLRGDAVVAQP